MFIANRKDYLLDGVTTVDENQRKYNNLKRVNGKFYYGNPILVFIWELQLFYI